MANAGLLQTSLIWVAYAVAVVLCLLAAIITTFTWQTPRERSAIVSIVAIISLTSLLATVLLLPVDIALISSTTHASLGVKKDWATEQRVHDILQTLRIVYYSLYSFDALLCLLIIPFAYFWHEEYDEIEVEEGRSFGSRLVSALKYTLVFVILVVILFLVGFFVPAAGDHNGANWDLDYFKRILVQNNGQKALSFALGLLVTLGVLLYVIYTAAGLALLPMSFIKSAPSISAPQLTESTATALEQNRERQRQLEMRNAGRPEGMSSKDRRELEALVREERTLTRRERLAAEASGEGRSTIYRVWLKICAVFRPIKLLGGILLLLLSVLIWVSMLITGIDKAKNSFCKGKCGYILGHINIFQPINWIFTQSAKAFPVDYILMALLVLFFFSSSISGIATVGIRFLWVRIFQIRKGRTAPQALLVATVMLALIILAINYAIANLVAPQYSIYGTQTFCTAPHHAGETPNCKGRPDYLVQCSEALDPEALKVCTPSIMAEFLNRIAITWPFFGALDFWAQFVFLGIFLIVFVTGLFRAPKLNVSELDEDAEEDEEEGLLASTGRRFGATWQDITGRTKSKSTYGTQDGNNGTGSSEA
ncbi:lysosomal cobalamin transporter [Colletotrichum tofieldiae]|uniref:Probable lysosomal cobalamin transporter n=1 Tax=Colletotrichum tofieldiae TaxID=708197 RepID=A0A166PL68_9PEZI|nr:lysosomal cobalamin transporter (LMBR1 domain containing 1) [Colletotrichum tofieldiae]GKT64610.1 lysosomal cobalamin transporter [Colletotrichum tofieldiae]GKT74582.1 lysosomal cobalamin transporter [Colletotrichum tofieldiae]GKT91765.1 lysosomal cobalamin transporter [Colletotrichum tofieldiae]